MSSNKTILNTVNERSSGKKPPLESATFNEIAQEESFSLYVINNAAKSLNKRMQAGIIHLTISTGEEDRQSVLIPYTWAPFDLSAQVDKKFILASSGFRRAVQAGAIKLMRAADAEKYLMENPDAAIESTRASQDLYSNNNFEDAAPTERKPAQPEPEWMRLAKEKMMKENSHQADIIQPEDFIGEEVDMKIVEAALRDDISEQELYTIVRNIDNDRGLTKPECDYVMENVKFDKVRSYVTNRQAG